ncbi:dynein regulatory complex protein 9 [Drosophila subobscura]|uniref:dynein regulatory complex protein 9 n=1 Tax=Drosophila subobscura TaxID=7241 RepID=UPI00155A69EE|nr:dynein regulatory complex protein 9 [Drosophila subobscura]
MSMTEMLRGKKKPEEKVNAIKMALHDFSSVRLIQIGCVIDVVAESIERVKISMILPKLLDNPTFMAKVLRGTQYEKAVDLVESFVRRREFILKEKRPPLMDHGIIKIIDYFQRNNQMYKMFPTYYNNMREEEKKLLVAFEMLFDLAKERLYRTSADVIAQERKLHAMYLENEGIKANVDLLKKKIHSQKMTLKWKMAAKEAYLKKYEDMLAKKKREKNERIQNEIDKCTRIVKKNQKESLEKQAVLEAELEKDRHIYEQTTKQNLHEEMEEREEKNKLLLQLQGLIKKYDHSIRDKMVENLELTDQYTKAKKELDAFMVGHRQIERVYKEVVVKHEDQERRARQNRILNFTMNRAASKIQVYWKKWKKAQQKKEKRLKHAKKK